MFTVSRAPDLHFWFEVRLPKSDVTPGTLCDDHSVLSGVRVLVTDDIEVNRRIPWRSCSVDGACGRS